MQQQLLTMLELQQAMNQAVHPDWRAQGFAWHRAIWIECAELLEHHGWKWWKKQQPDYPQVVLELVDIWHFGLSALLQQGQEVQALAQTIENQWQTPKAFTQLPEAIEALVLDVLKENSFPVATFAGVMQQAAFSFNDLFKLYIGKNMLNRFRQNNGYKQGHYVKEWRGREDNVHLTEILDQLSLETPHYQQAVYQALSERYALALQARA